MSGGRKHVDVVRTNALAKVMLVSVRAHYLADGEAPTRALVYEALNAVAVVIAAILEGSGAAAPELRKWFNTALDEQLTTREKDDGDTTH